MLCAIGVLVLTGVVAAATFRDYGLGWDDYTHSEYGDLLVSLYSSGFADKRALSFVNLYMYGGGFDLSPRSPPKFCRSACSRRAVWWARRSASSACSSPGGSAGGSAARSPV